MSSLFPGGAENVEEYQYKVHFLIQNGLPLCDTRNPKEGTEEKEKVTCKRCLSRLEGIDEVEERDNIPLALVATVTVESPPLTKNRVKKILLEWLQLIPDDAQIEFKSNYSSPTIMVATWKEDR